MDCSMPRPPDLHYLSEFAQTHVHWADDAIQPSHPLSPLSPAAFHLSQKQGLFQGVNPGIEVVSPVSPSILYHWTGEFFTTWEAWNSVALFQNSVPLGTSLVIQWLRLFPSSARDAGSIPGWRTKIPHATWSSQKQTKFSFSCNLAEKNVMELYKHWLQFTLLNKIFKLLGRALNCTGLCMSWKMKHIFNVEVWKPCIKVINIHFKRNIRCNRTCLPGDIN